jgi:LacI family transcriptional regulator, fructose operon transcriptional repressor
MAGIKDIAKKAGVSVATVSRVLSNKPHVRPEVREHILRVIQESGYRPSRIASGMRSQSSRIIGLMISDIRNPFFTAIARAIEDLANRQEMSIFLCNTDEDPDKEQLYLKTLLEERVAGVILSPTQEIAKVFDFLLESDTPVVAIDRRIEGANIDGVYCDNLVSAQLVTAHLIENGYRRIGAIFGLKGSMTGRERMEGYRLALAAHGLKLDPAFTCYVHPLEAEGEKIVSQWLKSDTRPDAILTGNSRLTTGALNAISEANLTIPDDIALAGFDETSWMRHAGPGITVICQPTYEIGRTAAELLFQRMADPTRPKREVVLKGQLLKRGSTLRKP